MRWGYFSLNAAGAVAGLVVKRLYVARIGKRKMKRQERIDRIELMRTYIRIVEAGSLSAAAGQMDTTQATVSRRLQSLEGLLGIKLILRTTHAMKLTDDGERCYRHARQVVDAWLALEDDLRIADDRPVGVLRVRAPHAFGQQQLLAPLVAFLQRHPQLSVEWMLNDNTVDFLSDNIDCAIRVGAEVDPATVSVLLAEVPRCVVASPELLAKYPPLTSLEALSGLPWIAINTFYQHEVRLRHQASGQIVSTAITPCLSTDSLYVARNTALAGLGVAMVSSWTVVEDIAAGRLIELFPQWRPASLPVHLVYPWARYYPTRLRKFLDLMREIMPDLAGMQRPQSA
ncbi:TPA: LysR family transcriptional regulator [Klebsiella pneumoniae]|nr:LysR family transcriptional regulator [Klebsiella pneumoniae]